MSVVLATPAIRRLRCTYPADPERSSDLAETRHWGELLELAITMVRLSAYSLTLPLSSDPVLTSFTGIR